MTPGRIERAAAWQLQCTADGQVFLHDGQWYLCIGNDGDHHQMDRLALSSGEWTSQIAICRMVRVEETQNAHSFMLGGLIALNILTLAVLCVLGPMIHKITRPGVSWPRE